MLTMWSRSGTPLVGAMIDVDQFKGINDTYGHSEGDKALVGVVEALREASNDREWVFRFAGDEFIVIGVGLDEEAVDDCLERAAVCLTFPARYNLSFPIGISWGISRFEEDVDDFLRSMDTQMYAMKSNHHQTVAEA